MARKGKVFNTLKRPKLLRKEIPAHEAAAGLALAIVLALAGWWLAAQRDAFDPGERDIETSVLIENSVQDTLYKTPLKRWRDPALGDVAAATLDLGPFPKSVLSEGWRQTERIETYTEENLYEKINGQAEQYRKFAFQQLDVLTLESADGAALDVFLYDQASYANALGLYAEQRGRTKKRIESLGPVRFTPSSLGASGIVGRYLFHVIGTEPSEAVSAKARQIAEALGSLAEEAETSAPFRALSEGLGIPFERLSYTPVNAFQFEFGKRFWFGAPDPDSELRVFVHQAENPAAAQALFTAFHGEQEGEYQVLDSRPGNAVYQHQFLKTFFSLRLDGDCVYGVEGAHQRAQVTEVLGRLRQALTADTREDGDQ